MTSSDMQGDPELRSTLAAEYVLGILRDSARDQFESLVRSDRKMVREVHRWERYFSDLNQTITPEEPPARVFAALQVRLFGDADASPVTASIAGWWRNLALATSALSLGLAAYVVFPLLDQQPAEPVAIEQPAEPVARAGANYIALLQKDDQAAWSVRADGESGELLVNAVGAPPINDTQDYQLWLLRPNDQAPLPLGLLPRDGKVALALPDEDLGAADGIAVSLEPKGGSPTDLPTGPVLYVAGLVEAG